MSDLRTQNDTLRITWHVGRLVTVLLAGLAYFAFDDVQMAGACLAAALWLSATPVIVEWVLKRRSRR